MVAQRRRRWPNNILLVGPMYGVIRVVAFQGIKRDPHGSQSKHGTITQFCFNVGPASNTIDRHCVYELHRIDAYTDLSVNVTVRSGVKETRSCIFHWQVLHGCWPAPAMVVEGIGIHVEDILVSLVLSISSVHLGFWPMRKTNTVMLTKHLANFLSKALKQTKVGSRSSGTPFLVLIIGQ